MTPHISVQLYTVDALLKQDYAATVRSIAEIGFGYVEPAGYPGFTAKEAAHLFNELGLKAPSGHITLPASDNKNAIIDEALMMGHKYLITGCPPGFGDNFTSLDKVKAMADLYSEAADYLAPHGLQVGYHNHDWDLTIVEGRRAHEIFLENTPDSVLYQPDLYWVARAGLDPVAFIQEIGVRGKTFHFKDGIVSPEAETKDGTTLTRARAAGMGQVDLIGASKAAKYSEFIVIEIDDVEGDKLEAIQESYRYLTTNNIAQGKI